MATSTETLKTKLFHREAQASIKSTTTSQTEMVLIYLFLYWTIFCPGSWTTEEVQRELGEKKIDLANLVSQKTLMTLCESHEFANIWNTAKGTSSVGFPHIIGQESNFYPVLYGTQALGSWKNYTCPIVLPCEIVTWKNRVHNL